MKWFLLFVLFGFARSTDVEVGCAPGARYADEDDTTECFCDDQGWLGKCTHIDTDNSPGSPGCVPGSIVYDEAAIQKCYCGTDGKISYCAVKTNSNRRYPGEINRKESKCTPGEMVLAGDGCNTCMCSEGGFLVCTKKLCDIPLQTSEAFEILSIKPYEIEELALGNRVKRQVCTPSSTFLQDCNVCKCDPDGTSFSCTQNECMEKGNRDVEVFMETEEKKQEKSANKTIVCEAKTSFTKECNTCWCNDDGTSYFCTRKVCVPTLDDNDEQPEEMQVIQKECRPGEVFEMDCNTCRCHDDGKSFFCTRRACVVDSPPDAVDYEAKSADEQPSARRIRRQTDSKSVVKACEPGVQFRMDCNTCLCHTDGQKYSCTRHDCISDQTQTAPTSPKRRRREVRASDCEPGQVFSQGCNVCRCSADGRHASCTLNKCATSTPDNHLDDKLEEGENGYRCTPGEQFRRECNDCTCSADGKGYFCTIKLCEKEIVSQLSQS